MSLFPMLQKSHHPRRSSTRPEVAPLEGRQLLTAYTFDPRIGEIRVEMSDLTTWGAPGDRYHTFAMQSVSAGSPGSKGDDFVVLDDGAGNRRLAVNVLTGRAGEVRVDQVRRIVVNGSELRERIILDAVSPKYGFSNVTAYVDGRGGDDAINGTDFRDTLIGGPGKDTLRGFGGDDHLDGGLGDDTLKGGAGRDIMLGAAGNDDLYFADDAPDHGDGGPGTNKAYDWRRMSHRFFHITKYV